MSTKVLVAPVGSLEAHCAGLALEREGFTVTCLPTDDVDLVVLFAGNDAAASSAELFEDDGAPPLLMVTPRVDDSARDRARRVGAAAVIGWDSPTQRLTREITSLVAPEELASMPDDDPMATLTARERDIVVLLREGATNEAIATSLGISYHTARTHVANVLSKLGVSHRYAVATLARGSGRLTAPPARSVVPGGAAC